MKKFKQVLVCFGLLLREIKWWPYLILICTAPTKWTWVKVLLVLATQITIMSAGLLKEGKSYKDLEGYQILQPLAMRILLREKIYTIL